jgi:hypothetical protein
MDGFIVLCCLLFGDGVPEEWVEGGGDDGGEEGLDIIPLRCSSIGIAKLPMKAFFQSCKAFI